MSDTWRVIRREAPIPPRDLKVVFAEGFVFCPDCDGHISYEAGAAEAKCRCGVVIGRFSSSQTPAPIPRPISSD